MKGISHFTIGVACASCFPAAVEAGANGNPLYFILGGVAGILPDTLDFKFYRYFYRHDMEVVPDPKKFDSAMVAAALAYAINKACGTLQPVTIKLAAVRLGADLWRQYEIRFDVAGKRITVRAGHAVNTSATPVIRAAEADCRPASAPFDCDLKLDYDATITVDAFDGPMFTMHPVDGRRVMARFIPWHREWTHSLTLSLILGLLAALAAGPLAGIVVFCGAAAHVAADQLGFMGSNLFYPFTKERSSGLKKIHSADALPNLAAVWISCLLIFWNIYAAQSPAQTWLNPLKLLFYALALPALAIFSLKRFLNSRSV